METERILLYAFIFFMVCATLMISQCSYHKGKCQEEAIKSGKFTNLDISSMCR